MIVASTKGEELFREMLKDLPEVHKEVKRVRKEMRESYKKAKIKNIPWTEKDFRIRTGQYNTWYVRTAMAGDPSKPKALTHHHCSGNFGLNGERQYIIYRGNKSGDGYVVRVCAHVLTRMRDRRPEEFRDIKDNDILTCKIFSMDEEGVYFDFDWRRKGEEEICSEQSIDPMAPKVVESGIPIVLKTLAGLFLGFASQDRAEVKLITYIKEPDEGDQKEMVEQFLEPCYVAFNHDKFPKELVEKVTLHLQTYIRTREDREVYRLRL